jgi:hypothetical protein
MWSQQAARGRDMDRLEAERSEAWKARRKAYQLRVESIRKRLALKPIVRPMTREEELRAIESFIASGRVVRLPSAYVGDDRDPPCAAARSISASDRTMPADDG